MAHETRTQPDVVWVDGYTIPRADWESLEGKAFRSINGVRGGCWAPTSPISLTGLGTTLLVTGPTEIKGNGVLELNGSANVRLQGGHFPRLDEGHVGRSRTFVQSTVPCMAVGAYPWAVATNRKYACAQPLALTLADSGGVESTPEFLVPLRVHDGSTLERVVFHFRVPAGRTRAPAEMPRFRVFRVNAMGETSELKATANEDGFASPVNPGSASAWYAGGEAQQFVYDCDQNNEIDITTYCYFAHIVEEAGGLEYPEKLPVFTSDVIHRASHLAYNLAGTTGSTFIDGAPFFQSGPTQPPCILKDQVAPSQNGLYQAQTISTNPLIRSPYFEKEGQIANGTLFPISPSTGATVNSYTVWQIVLPTPFVFGSSPVRFVRPVPTGNIYHSVETRFTNIVDTRWQ